MASDPTPEVRKAEAAPGGAASRPATEAAGVATPSLAEPTPEAVEAARRVLAYVDDVLIPAHTLSNGEANGLLALVAHEIDAATARLVAERDEAWTALSSVHELALHLGACDECAHTNPACRIVQVARAALAPPAGAGGDGG